MPNGRRIDIIRRIKNAGYLREFDIALHLKPPRLTIEMNPWHSAAFDYHGGMGLVLELRIASNRVLRIQDFGDVELLEKPCNVVWWANEGSNFYKFDRGPEYPRDVVLNHCFGRHGTVKPGQPLEGMLLGYSATPIPSQYSHGLRLPLTLSILDGFDNQHTAQLYVQVDEYLCSKIRRASRSSLYRPRLDKKADLVDELQDLGSQSRQQTDTDGSEADSAEPQPGGKERTRA